METLPGEVLFYIFNQLDDASLPACELVCTKWRNVMVAEKIFTKKVSANSIATYFRC